jgi:hypothetical protein
MLICDGQAAIAGYKKTMRETNKLRTPQKTASARAVVQLALDCGAYTLAAAVSSQNENVVIVSPF